MLLQAIIIALHTYHNGKTKLSDLQARYSQIHHYCKVALATLRTELTQIQECGYTAVDLTSPGLSMPYQSFMA